MNLKEAREIIKDELSRLEDYWEAVGFIEGYEAGVREAAAKVRERFKYGLVEEILKLLQREDEGTLLDEGKV